MAETFIKDGVTYNSYNRRMCYDKDYHENHKKPFTVKELAFICSSWHGMKKADIALALGRTHTAVLQQAYKLRKSGEFDYYKNLDC